MTEVKYALHCGFNEVTKWEEMSFKSVLEPINAILIKANGSVVQNFDIYIYNFHIKSHRIYEGNEVAHYTKIQYTDMIRIESWQRLRGCEACTERVAQTGLKVSATYQCLRCHRKFMII